jgi:hypothetical protein
MLYHWDSYNFALALEHFDIRLHQPHPPGYFLYVMAGRMVNLCLQDANSSLVLLSILFSGLTATSLFFLAREMFDERTAVIAALLFLTSPMFWFHGEIALARIVEAFFVTHLALICYKLLKRTWRYPWVAGLVLALAGGVRLNTLVLLFPLWLCSVRRSSRRDVALGIVVFTMATAAWLIPMLYVSGGLSGYLEVAKAETQGYANYGISGLRAAPANTARLIVFLLYTLLASSLVIAYAFWLHLRGITAHGIKMMWQDERVQTMALWIAPTLLLCTYVLTQPGQTFTFMPSLLIIAAVASVGVSEDVATRARRLLKKPSGGASAQFSMRLNERTVNSGLVAALVLINVLFFLAAPPYPLGIERNALNTPSWHSISARDAYLVERISFIRDEFRPEDTVIVGTGLDLRAPEYYLRDYASIHLAQGYDSGTITLPAGTTLVLFTRSLNRINGLTERTETAALPSGATLSYIESSLCEHLVVTGTEIGLLTIPCLDERGCQRAFSAHERERMCDKC